MTTEIMATQIAIGSSKVWKQMGNHLFVINADMVNVYEGFGYTGFAMTTVKELHKTFLISNADNWDTIADRFFGKVTA